jgi:DNA-directed RNA polymerase subunit RPC12/RpoP
MEKLEPHDLENKIEEKKSTDNKEPDKKKYNIRCPQCKHIFFLKNDDKATKIKCPACGKKGIIK